MLEYTQENERQKFATTFCQLLIFHFGILSILLILSVLSRFSAGIVIQALVTKHDVVRGRMPPYTVSRFAGVPGTEPDG